MKTKNHKATISNYYDMQEVQDKLYADSLQGKIFIHLMDKISSYENIKLAYRAIKTNSGSYTVGTDNKNILFFAKMEEDEYVEYIQKILSNYHPKKVRRVEIPKPNGKLRPLGIPTIEDRIVQQSILQILEPICQAKFYNKSYGFRPNRSAENAIAEAVRLMQRSHLQFVVDVDIKGFFDNVNHRKLMRQLWTLGIRDTQLLQIIKQMLRAPILMPDRTVVYPKKGTPQGDILSPLLANIVLNELDWWIASQWEQFSEVLKHPPKPQYGKEGRRNRGHEYRIMRNTRLKEMYIVRYADDFKIFCKSRKDAIKIRTAVVKWLSERLKLEVSEDKSGITNLKRKYSEFLGFKLRLRNKGKKEVVYSRMCDKAAQRAEDKLKKQIKLIQKPKDDKQLYKRINIYNSMVLGIQNYYRIANNSCEDFRKIQYNVSQMMYSRLKIKHEGIIKNVYLRKRYGQSKQVVWLMEMPIIPIGYCKSRNPMSKKSDINQYTPKGRSELYRPPDVDIGIMQYIMRNPVRGMSVEYNDNRVSLYVGQRGKCAVTGEELVISEMHCHHKIPVKKGGSDRYYNLIFVTENVHRLIHATNPNTISQYLSILNLNKKKLDKLNKLRVTAGLEIIE